LRERFQKNFLRRIFRLTSFTKEPARNTKNSRTESSYYFREGRLVAFLRSARQVEFGGLFNPTLQMRSSPETGWRILNVTRNPPVPWGRRLVLCRAARFALFESSFALRFRLFQLGFLLSRQNGKHLLMELEPLAHQLGFKGSHFRQFLSSQSFVERTAFARLTQLLPFRTKLVERRLVALSKAFADCLHLSFLVVSEIEASEELATAHSSHAFMIASTTATPLWARTLFLIALRCGHRLGNSDRGS
jgi:hypothetical protein